MVVEVALLPHMDMDMDNRVDEVWEFGIIEDWLSLHFSLLLFSWYIFQKVFYLQTVDYHHQQYFLFLVLSQSFFPIITMSSKLEDELPNIFS